MSNNPELEKWYISCQLLELFLATSTSIGIFFYLLNYHRHPFFKILASPCQPASEIVKTKHIFLENNALD